MEITCSRSGAAAGGVRDVAARRGAWLDAGASQHPKPVPSANATSATAALFMHPS
jgi:hypothetical protein